MIESMDLENVFGRIERETKIDRGTSEKIEVEMLVERGEQFSVSYQSGKTDKFESTVSRCAGFRVLLNGYPGYAYSEDLSEETLLTTYRQALENARFTSLADDPSLKMALMPNLSEVAESKDLFNDSLALVSIEEKLERGRQLEAVALAADKRINSVPYNNYSESEGEIQIFNSRGVRRRQRLTSVRAMSYCLAKSGDEARMSGESTFLRNARDLDAVRVAELAAKRTLEKLGAVTPETGNYRCLIEGECAAELLSLLVNDFSSRAVFEKSSLLGSYLGQSIANAKLTIVDDPFYKDGVGSRAFDSEGAQSRVTTLIEKGRLAAFLTNSVFAERMKLPHTAHASRNSRSELDISATNLVVQPGQKSFEELRATPGKVLVITDLAGFHSGYQRGSGDFSLPADGELWVDGEKRATLGNFVVSGNLLELLKNIEDMSSRISLAPGQVKAPDFMVRELSIAGSAKPSPN